MLMVMCGNTRLMRREEIRKRMLGCCHIAFLVIDLHIIEQLLHEGFLLTYRKGGKQRGIINRRSFLQQLFQEGKQLLADCIEKPVIICDIRIDLIAVQHIIIIAFLIGNIGQNLFLLLNDLNQMRFEYLIIILLLRLMPGSLTISYRPAVIHIDLSWQYTQIIQLP